MRDKSGRSGRRLGSQKPGTACGAASVGALGMDWACAGPDRDTANQAASIAPARRRLAIGSDLAGGDTAICNRVCRGFFNLLSMISSEKPVPIMPYGTRTAL